jgi:hypothetical protein
MLVTMKNAIFWYVTPCGVLQLLVATNVPSLWILFIPMMEAVRS